MSARGWLAAFFAGVVALAVYFYNKPSQGPVNAPLIAAPAPELKHVGTEPLQISMIKVFKPEAKRKLNLPKEIQNDPAEHVIAATKTANDERQHTVITTIDARTGEATTYDRVDPLPWLAVNTKSQVGIFYGFKNGGQVIRIEGQQEFLQIKAAHLGVAVSADAGAGGVDGFVGVGMWARW